MKRVLLILLLLFLTADEAYSEKVCSYQDVVDYLNLTADNSVFKLTRPVLDYTRPTTVKLEVLLYAILGVIEKTQTFIPLIWVTEIWTSERITWNPEDFCGISHLTIPDTTIWKPDIFIYEMTEKDNSPHNPYLVVHHDGTIMLEQDMKVVSTCQMDIHKFPFDTQKCRISFGSGVHPVEEIRLLSSSNASRATQFSRRLIHTQGEWDFLQVSISSNNISFGEEEWEQLIYTFTVKRRPLLHVLNLLLPILFFLILDIASFFIADHRGEKLGFKVTVMLAISVLLLILNDILPSMSNKTPLIATYCIVIFGLMLLSLLETILVTYLMEKDFQNRLRRREKRENKVEKVKVGNSHADDRQPAFCSCVCKSSESEKPDELLSVVEEVNNEVQSGETRVLLLILEQLKELQKTQKIPSMCWEEGGKFAQWAKKINNVFFVAYVGTVSLFLPLISMEWVN